MKKLVQRRSIKLLIVSLIVFCVIIRPGSTLLNDFLYHSSYKVESAPKQLIAIAEQPFYPRLEGLSKRWEEGYLDAIVSSSPGQTLLNFYSAMSYIGNSIDKLMQADKQESHLAWSKDQKNQIAYLVSLAKSASKALDTSGFPFSARDKMGIKAAIQLKEVLDYMFLYSPIKIDIPEKSLDQGTRWQIANTPIYLTKISSPKSAKGDFIFSANTVSSISKLHKELSEISRENNEFASPRFYENVVYTPGRLLPPKWYFRLPESLKRSLEIHNFEISIFQIVGCFILILFFICIASFLFGPILETYRKASASDINKSQYEVYKKRLLLLFPVIPASNISSDLAENYLNLHGMPLLIFTYAFQTIYYLTLSLFVLYLLEAGAFIASEWYVNARSDSSDLELRQVNSLLLPIARLVGAVTALILIYRLLIELGVPAQTIFVFSAVPGLAISLGASQLIKNLLSGLSIKADQPLRVGELCKIGDNVGFITKIGIRSMEIETLESKVRIPNSAAAETTIVNYSQLLTHPHSSALKMMQSLNLRINIDEPIQSSQIERLLLKLRNHLKDYENLYNSIVTIEQSERNKFTIIFFGLTPLDDWPSYLDMREKLLISFKQIMATILLSTIVLSLPIETTLEKIEKVPGLINDAIKKDPCFEMRECGSMSIYQSNYNFLIILDSSHAGYDSFITGIHALNDRMTISFASQGIEIYTIETLQGKS